LTTFSETTIDSSHHDFHRELAPQRNDTRPAKTTAATPEIVAILLPAALLAVAVGDEVVVLAVILVQLEVALPGTVALADSVKSAHW
jgi:hypothetical protein